MPFLGYFCSRQIRFPVITTPFHLPVLNHIRTTACVQSLAHKQGQMLTKKHCKHTNMHTRGRLTFELFEERMKLIRHPICHLQNCSILTIESVDINYSQVRRRGGRVRESEIQWETEGERDGEGRRKSRDGESNSARQIETSKWRWAARQKQGTGVQKQEGRPFG